jgi:hypothetical protein
MSHFKLSSFQFQTTIIILFLTQLNQLKMIWTTVKFKEILESSLQEYLKTSGDDQQALLKEVRHQIRNHGEKSGEKVPADLKQVTISLFQSIQSY